MGSESFFINHIDKDEINSFFIKEGAPFLATIGALAAKGLTALGGKISGAGLSSVGGKMTNLGGRLGSASAKGGASVASVKGTTGQIGIGTAADPFVMGPPGSTNAPEPFDWSKMQKPALIGGGAIVGGAAMHSAGKKKGFREGVHAS